MNGNSFEKYVEIKPEHDIATNVLNASLRKINPNLSGLIFKYGAIFTSSIFLSLILCPQRGVGLLRNEYPFFHHLLHQSEVLCGLYCGFVFFLTTHLLTFFLLSHFERLKIVKSFSFLPVLFMASFFGFSMTSFFSSSQLGLTYNISWVLIVGFSYLLLNFSYIQKLKKVR